MQKSSTSQVLGCFSLLVVIVNTTFWGVLIFLVALVKLIVPSHGWRVFCSRGLNAIGLRWIGINNLGLQLTKQIRWEIEGLEGLKADAW